MKKRNIKYFAAGMLICGLILAAFWWIQVYMRKQQEMQNIQTVYQILGELQQGEDQLQIAADILKGNENQSAEETGEKILTQYGYDKNDNSVYTERLHTYQTSLAAAYLVLAGILGIVFAAYLHFIQKDHRKELGGLVHVLEQFQSGHYDVLTEKFEEGERSGIYDRLESLGQKLKLNEQRLVDEKEETKILVTDISHQLKTPVASIRMCYQLLDDEDLKPEEREEFLHRLGEQILHLNGLLSALVNISRMEAGMITIRKQPAKIFQTVVQAVNEVYLKAEEKEIEIMMSKTDEQEIEPLILPHDPQWTKEAIVNVLENAIKYSPKHTRIRIHMLKQQHFLRIEISDEGIGINKEEVNQIFHRFYRGKNETVAHTAGSGVGLYLTRKILEEQGGNITVALPMNQKKGRGSTFAIMLSLE